MAYTEIYEVIASSNCLMIHMALITSSPERYIHDDSQFNYDLKYIKSEVLFMFIIWNPFDFVIKPESAVIVIIPYEGRVFCYAYYNSICHPNATEARVFSVSLSLSFQL